MGRDNRTCTIGFIKPLIDYLTGQSCAPDTVLAQIGIAPGDLVDLDKRISLARVEAAFEIAETLTDDSHVGLHAGQLLKPGYYGIVGVLVMSCRTLREVVPVHSRYQSLVADTVTVSYEYEADVLRMVSIHPHAGPPQSRHLQEYGLATLITFGRFLSGEEEAPSRMALMRPAPPQPEICEAFFGCQVDYQTERDLIEFPIERLDLPLPQANPGLRDALEAKAELMLLELGVGPEDALEKKLQSHLIGALAQGDLDIDGAARSLGMSRRALQRSLAQRNTTFTRFLDQTRQSLAQGYIQDSSLSMTEVAFLLGFSEQSAFNRAFRRWKGCSPSAWRRGLLAPVNTPSSD